MIVYQPLALVSTKSNKKRRGRSSFPPFSVGIDLQGLLCPKNVEMLIDNDYGVGVTSAATVIVVVVTMSIEADAALVPSSVS